MNIQLEDIHKLVQEPYLSRGKKCFDKGTVKIILLQATKVNAYVVGTHVYKIEFKRQSKMITATCTCPAFSDFGPCKHIAAVAFALKERNGYRTSYEASCQINDYEEQKKHFESFSKKELIDLIMRMISEYPDVMDYI